jgi:hypothetical protein
MDDAKYLFDLSAFNAVPAISDGDSNSARRQLVRRARFVNSFHTNRVGARGRTEGYTCASIKRAIRCRPAPTPNRPIGNKRIAL